MQVWYSALEIASALKISVQAVQKRAKAYDWQPRRNRRGRGGGWEYHAQALPKTMQVKLAPSHVFPSLEIACFSDSCAKPSSEQKGVRSRTTPVMFGADSEHYQNAAASTCRVATADYRYLPSRHGRLPTLAAIERISAWIQQILGEVLGKGTDLVKPDLASDDEGQCHQIWVQERLPQSLEEGAVTSPKASCNPQLPEIQILSEGGATTLPIRNGKQQDWSAIASAEQIICRVTTTDKNNLPSIQPLPEYGCTTAEPSGDIRHRRRDARLTVLEMLQDFRAKHGLKLCKAREEFTRRFNQKAIAVADWVRSVVTSISVSTLQNWEKKLKNSGDTNILAENRGRHSKRTSKIDAQSEMKAVVEGMLLHRSDLIREELAARFPDREIPSLRAIERWIKKWKQDNPAMYAALQNKHLYNSKFRPAFGSVTEDVIYANQRWQIDATKADIRLADGIRYSVLLIVDVFSRRPPFVCKTSSAKNLVQGTQSANHSRVGSAKRDRP